MLLKLILIKKLQHFSGYFLIAEWEVIMNQKTIDKIIELYTLYEFTVEDKQTDFIVFHHNKGYFNNIEIVLLSDNFDINTIKKQYEDVGFSITVKKFTSFEEIHQKLFDGFFKLEYTKKKIKTNHAQFCQMQTAKRIIAEEYKYIECEYTLNYEPSSEELTSFIINQINNEDNSNLIIIEAAAGYGKTCLSYQMLYALSESYDKKIPLLAELSKNRKASIFRYVLLSEIDANFSGLKYELVEKEILNGNIILIIDGFDELLSKAIEKQIETNNEQIKDAQTMLDTIANFLTGKSKSKIILTSRKSSIFTGEVFDNWIEKRQLTCSIDRIQLGQPNPVKWVGKEKAIFLKENMSELYSIVNPILLDTIRNIDNEKLTTLSNDDVIENYFDNLLSREKERQALIMSKEEQIDTMQKLAAQFVEFDISSEEPKCLSEILGLILEDKLDDYVEKYKEQVHVNEEALPSKEEFLSKLVHHAFLDRISINKSNIGFINEFIFGWLIGEAIINNILNSSNAAYKYLDIATTAFSVRNEEKRLSFYEKIERCLDKLDEEQRLYLESKLLCHASKNYSMTTFDSLIFNERFVFRKEERFTNCSFYNCTFKNCRLSLNSFEECQFINCVFYCIDFIDESEIDNQLIFVSCNGHGEFSEKASVYKSNNEEGKDYKKILLEQFWKIGRRNAEPRCGKNTVYRGIPKNDIRYIDEALTELVTSGLIKKLSVCYELNFSRIDEIKAILGR